MTSKHRSLSIRVRLAITVVASAGLMIMAGCGLGTSPITAGSAVSSASFGGKLNGGPNPIAGAIVKLYATGNPGGGNGGYGVGQFLQEANVIPGHSAGYETASDGSFTFAGGYPCPLGQELYIVSVGGDTGAGYNGKAYLVAALGRCDDLFSGGKYTGGFIYLNELSTVAAAYALGNFATVTGTDVYIGAPTTNNASVGCVNGFNGCTATAAAGLRHAFQNAINLVNPFSPNANSTVPSNSAAKVPLQLIDSIANVVVACVNSTGANAACSTLFAATTTNPSTGNTFSALVNLAKNPTLDGTGVSPSQFFAAATPNTNFYQPLLTAAPTDYSIAISIPLTGPESGALDINDNFYVGNYSAGGTAANAVSFNSNATLVSTTASDATNVTAEGASVDEVGHLYLVGQTSANAGDVSRFSISPSTGAISSGASFGAGSSPLYASAVDQHDNLWVGSRGTTNSVGLVLANGTSVVFSATVAGNVGYVAIDPNQNIWAAVSTASAGTNGVTVLQNTGSASSPTYGTVLSTTTPLTLASGVSFVSGSPYTAYVANAGGVPSITKVTPTLTGPEVTSLTVGTQSATGTPTRKNQTDGNGIIWAAGSTNVVKFNPGLNAVTVITPCVLPTVTTNTACSSSPYTGLLGVSIDSTGSIWFVDPATGKVGELIGAASPTVPLLSLGLLTKP